MPEQLIRVAHSPDSDDAFMFHALANEKINTGNFRFEHILRDIETLNQWALEGRFEVTAVSIHAYAYLSDKYALLPHGASMGEQYGPRLVAREKISPDDLAGRTIGVPGTMTSAFLALNLFLPEPKYKVLSMEEIMPAVQSGDIDVGLIIHEGQLTYVDAGLELILDFGEWWYQETGLPLPLGGNVIRRDLGEETIFEVSRLLHDSIQYALENRQEALDYALQYAPEMETSLADEFVGMYVNDRTLDYGEEGRRAVREFLKRGVESGVVTRDVEVEFVGGSG
ncbi:MAG: ABC transporter substrate-binding protein [Planctomycetota bacterium]|jgi:1,4-dihydroxy-6-naphthoate synthase|nr:ABC transporter substrate-binding protein [Planctomycetota bacterium]MDP7132616.1 ABC transporter substrate-binding protein [Planctomycetota bacterium]MDP7254719.1 ABC transporter substrate-binding protein [Planctomycetota bacterium]